MPHSVAFIPHAEELKPSPGWTPTTEEQERGAILHPRIDRLLEGRQPYEAGMERSLLLYSGKSRLNPKDPRKERVVIPFARIFVEAKTSEEIRATSEYDFIPVEDAGDSWKVDLIKDVNKHVQRKTKMRAKKFQLLRMKNICGVSIARVGYRCIKRVIKQRVPEGHMEYRTIEVPVYDDLFFDCVSPLSFAVDPNATTMDDAMDCVHFHEENWESFYETYANNDMFKNTEFVRPGVHGKFIQEGFKSGFFRGQGVDKNIVLVTEYFNKIRDEWVIFANGVEIYYGPLPDDHKELPFVSYHNNPSFVSGYIEDVVARTSDGSETTPREQVRAEETFWTQGDPETIMDLIDLRTGFSRAAYRALKLAGETLILTAGNFTLNEAKPWTSGMQVPGGMNKVQPMPLGGNPNIGGFQFVFDDLFQLKILTTGVDPRSLADGKNKTATESAIQRETSMRRLEANIEYNEENGEVRLGTLIFKLIQQYYSKPELVRLTGLEDEDQLSEFDEVEEDENGVAFAGKRMRTIRSTKKMKEKKRKRHDGTYKYMLHESDEGVSAFLARPEYIRTSDIDIGVQSGRKTTQIQAVRIEQTRQAIELAVQLFQLAMTPNSPVRPEDLPNLREMVREYMKSLGFNPETSVGQSGGEEKPQEDIDAEDAMKEYMQNKTDFNPPMVPREELDPSTLNVG